MKLIPVTVMAFGLASAAMAAEVKEVTGQSALLTFDAPATRTLHYHAAATSSPGHVLTDVQEQTYNLINLEPETAYEIQFAPYDAAEATQTLHVKTTTAAPVKAAGISAGPFRKLSTFPDNVWYPTIEYHDGKLWLIESYKGQLHLSSMDPATSKVLSSIVIVDQPHAGRETYLGIMDSTIHDGKLWIMYNEQDTQVPGGYHIKMSRQKILSYDLASGKLSAPVAVEPIRAESGTWEGGIEVLNGKLWTACLDVWLENNKRRTDIVMREFDGQKFGEPIVFEDCPTDYPYGPSISPFGDKLVLIFSDLILWENDKNREPLYYTTFDGKSFAPARIIFDEGRNRYAKGVQMGDRFVMAWKSNADWWEEHGYKYHDITMGALNPESGELEIIPAVVDRKYNSSPDLTLVSPGHAVMVLGKFEHEYNRSDPAYNHGAYIGDILLDRPAK